MSSQLLGPADVVSAFEPRIKVRRVRLSEIFLDPANTRMHNARNLATIDGSLRAFGQVEPLVVQKSTGRIIGGNGRYAAMMAAGVEECDITEIDISDERATALSIALNRTAELAEWDYATLAAVARDLDPGLLADAGWDQKEVEALIGLVNLEAPEPAPLPGKDEKPVEITVAVLPSVRPEDVEAAVRAAVEPFGDAVKVSR